MSGDGQVIPGPDVSFLRLSERIAGTVTWEWPEPPAEAAEDTTTGEEPAA